MARRIGPAGPAELEQIADGIMHGPAAETYPHLRELITEHVLKPGYDYADEFEYGLTLILDALRPDDV